LFSGLQPQLFAENRRAFPSLEPHEYVFGLSSIPEPLPLEDFIDTALLFSGIEYNSIYIEKSRIWNELHRLDSMDAFKTGSAIDSDTIEKKRRVAEYLLEYLHERHFRNYSERQTRVDIALEKGIYNCVSSAIIYMIFAKYLGFDVAGVRTRDHAFCLVKIDGKTFDVETTSRFGFDPGKKKEFKDQFGKITGYAYVPPGNYRKRENIGEKAMLALILYNRNAFLSEKRQFDKALKVAADAYAYLHDEESFDRLATTVNNLASLFGMRNQNSEGLDFLDAAMAKYGAVGMKSRVSVVYGKLLHNMIVQSVNLGKYKEAGRILGSKRAKHYLAKNERKNLSVYLYMSWAGSLAANRTAEGYEMASEVLESAIEHIGRDNRLLAGYEAYVHNAFITYVKNKKLDQAKRFIYEKSKLYPGSTLLKKDISYIERR